MQFEHYYILNCEIIKSQQENWVTYYFNLFNKQNKLNETKCINHTIIQQHMDLNIKRKMYIFIQCQI